MSIFRLLGRYSSSLIPSTLALAGLLALTSSGCSNVTASDANPSNKTDPTAGEEAAASAVGYTLVPACFSSVPGPDSLDIPALIKAAQDDPATLCDNELPFDAGNVPHKTHFLDIDLEVGGALARGLLLSVDDGGFFVFFDKGVGEEESGYSRRLIFDSDGNEINQEENPLPLNEDQLVMLLRIGLTVGDHYAYFLNPNNKIRLSFPERN